MAGPGLGLAEDRRESTDRLGGATQVDKKAKQPKKPKQPKTKGSGTTKS